MDERADTSPRGKPIASWDLKHRLYIDQSAGPCCKDGGTIFRINSKFMDICDQSYMYRHVTSLAIFALLLGTSVLLSLSFFANFNEVVVMDLSQSIIFNFVLSSAIVINIFLAFKAGRDEFFSLRTKPIRFSRERKKIYAIRRRSFNPQKGDGDITWECDWAEKSIFCIHKQNTNIGTAYDIRYYEVDTAGLVTRTFGFGKCWHGKEGIEDLLSQWNYWCVYMNMGPSALPLPRLFFSEAEDFRESFLFCLYEFGLQTSVAVRIFFMPFILIETVARRIALKTCRHPVWPKYISEISSISSDDEFDQPSGKTPVGWAETVLAIERNEYPPDPQCTFIDWALESDPKKHAKLWAADVPTTGLAMSSLVTSVSTESYYYPHSLRKNADGLGGIVKDERGRKVIRLGDQTSHGGKVISASDSLKSMGVAVALSGDMTV